MIQNQKLKRQLKLTKSRIFFSGILAVFMMLFAVAIADEIIYFHKFGFAMQLILFPYNYPLSTSVIIGSAFYFFCVYAYRRYALIIWALWDGGYELLMTEYYFRGEKFVIPVSLEYLVIQVLIFVSALVFLKHVYPKIQFRKGSLHLAVLFLFVFVVVLYLARDQTVPYAMILEILFGMILGLSFKRKSPVT